MKNKIKKYSYIYKSGLIVVSLLAIYQIIILLFSKSLGLFGLSLMWLPFIPFILIFKNFIFSYLFGFILYFLFGCIIGIIIKNFKK